MRDAAAFTSEEWTCRPTGGAETQTEACAGTHCDLLSHRSGTWKILLQLEGSWYKSFALMQLLLINLLLFFFFIFHFASSFSMKRKS